jgi:hypothetical protein
MKIALISFVCFLIFCIRTPEQIESNIDNLIQKEKELKNSVIYLNNSVTNLNNTIQVQNQKASSLREEVKILEYQKKGGEVEYILKLKLCQERIGVFDAIDIEANMKDHYNAVDFEISVDKRTFLKYNINDKILESFRKGSSMTEGSKSNWVIKVIDKKTILL